MYYDTLCIPVSIVNMLIVAIYNYYNMCKVKSSIDGINRHNNYYTIHTMICVYIMLYIKYQLRDDWKTIKNYYHNIGCSDCHCIVNVSLHAAIVLLAIMSSRCYRSYIASLR